MRFPRILAGVIVLLAAASAAELKIKVVDPQSAAVAGAQVELFRGDTSTPAAIQTTSAEGVATFRGIESADYRARVLAAGFAMQTLNISPSDAQPVSVRLGLARAAETVTVSATRTLVPGNEAGADVES